MATWYTEIQNTLDSPVELAWIAECEEAQSNASLTGVLTFLLFRVSTEINNLSILDTIDPSLKAWTLSTLSLAHGVLDAAEGPDLELIDVPFYHAVRCLGFLDRLARGESKDEAIDALQLCRSANELAGSSLSATTATDRSRAYEEVSVAATRAADAAIERRGTTWDKDLTETERKAALAKVATWINQGLNIQRTQFEYGR